MLDTADSPHCWASSGSLVFVHAQYFWHVIELNTSKVTLNWTQNSLLNSSREEGLPGVRREEGLPQGVACCYFGNSWFTIGWQSCVHMQDIARQGWAQLKTHRITEYQKFVITCTIHHMITKLPSNYNQCQHNRTQESRKFWLKLPIFTLYLLLFLQYVQSWMGQKLP